MWTIGSVWSVDDPIRPHQRLPLSLLPLQENTHPRGKQPQRILLSALSASLVEFPPFLPLSDLPSISVANNLFPFVDRARPFTAVFEPVSPDEESEVETAGFFDAREDAQNPGLFFRLPSSLHTVRITRGSDQYVPAIRSAVSPESVLSSLQASVSSDLEQWLGSGYTDDNCAHDW